MPAAIALIVLAVIVLAGCGTGSTPGSSGFPIEVTSDSPTLRLGGVSVRVPAGWRILHDGQDKYRLQAFPPCRQMYCPNITLAWFNMSVPTGDTLSWARSTDANPLGTLKTHPWVHIGPQHIRAFRSTFAQGAKKGDGGSSAIQYGFYNHNRVIVELEFNQWSAGAITGQALKDLQRNVLATLHVSWIPPQQPYSWTDKNS